MTICRTCDTNSVYLTFLSSQLLSNFYFSISFLPLPSFQHTQICCVVWCTPVIPACEMWRQGGQAFRATLDYIHEVEASLGCMNPYLREKSKNQKHSLYCCYWIVALDSICIRILALGIIRKIKFLPKLLSFFFFFQCIGLML